MNRNISLLERYARLRQIRQVRRVFHIAEIARVLFIVRQLRDVGTYKIDELSRCDESVVIAVGRSFETPQDGPGEGAVTPAKFGPFE
jgi:hypothetical protein